MPLQRTQGGRLEVNTEPPRQSLFEERMDESNVGFEEARIGILINTYLNR